MGPEGAFLSHAGGDFTVKTPEGIRTLRVNLLDERRAIRPASRAIWTGTPAIRPAGS